MLMNVFSFYVNMVVSVVIWMGFIFVIVLWVGWDCVVSLVGFGFLKWKY